MKRDWSRRRFTKRGAATALSCMVLPRALARPARAAGKAKVVVIGGGPGGATAARYLAKYGAGSTPGIEITLVERNATYTTCFFGNLHL
ncbi:MAG: FAD-dependent oxidoreductase, partial [Rhodospirillales bacterium]|nr:FAD-dependent oxidoreductase [Rhodospirillales bacterium]